MTLQEARIKSGLSVRQAAKAAGVFPSTVVGWELHGRMPPLETLMKVAGVYGVEATAITRGAKKATTALPSVAS